MYGAILGDIAGSKYEFSRPEKFDPWKVKIFSNDCCFTDDTVMTIATKYAVLKGVPYAKAYGVFGRKYPNVGYGTMFKDGLTAIVSADIIATVMALLCGSVSSANILTP